MLVVHRHDDLLFAVEENWLRQARCLHHVPVGDEHLMGAMGQGADIMPSGKGHIALPDIGVEVNNQPWPFRGQLCVIVVVRQAEGDDIAPLNGVVPMGDGLKSGCGKDRSS